MIKRSDYTKEMWARKSELDLTFNALFMGQEFRGWVVSETDYCPKDLNFDTLVEDDGRLSLLCCMKHYGYETSENKGQVGSDLGDYDVDEFKGETGERYWPLLCQYISEKSPELSDKLEKLNCTIYW